MEIMITRADARNLEYAGYRVYLISLGCLDKDLYFVTKIQGDIYGLI